MKGAVVSVMLWDGRSERGGGLAVSKMVGEVIVVNDGATVGVATTYKPLACNICIILVLSDTTHPYY